MSWLFSRALVAAYWPATCSDGTPYAPLNIPSTPQAFLCSDKTMDICRRSRFGMTFAPLTESHGEGLLILFRADSRAKRSAPPPEAIIRRKTSGRKCGESWQMSLPGVSLPRTSRKGLLTTPLPTLNRWATKPRRYPYPRRTWVATTFGHDIGYLHTPTATGNYCATSMQKHPCAREFRRVFGQVTPHAHEWLMGWPIDWSALGPLAMDKFQSWRQAHFLS